jgi:Ca-activated chloride channel family protein
MWVLIVPALLAVVGAVAMLAAPSGSLGFDGMSLVWLLLAAPAAVALGCYAHARRRAAMGRFVSDTLAPLLAGEVSPTRQAIRAGLMVTVLLLVGVAVLGPRWGLYMEKTEAHGVDVVAAIDVSRSMLARDLAPNRLEYAKRTIREQLTERSAFGRMNRLGLLAFAGSTSMKVPLTLDQPFFRQALEQIDLTSAPRGGTAIAEAIYESAAFFKTSPKEAAKILLIFTDGEDHVGDPVTAAKEMFDEYGIVTYCIGVGDPTLPAGAEVPADATPGSKPLVHEGQLVFSKLNPEALSTIAEAGQGRYVPAADFGLLIGHLSQLQKQKITAEERQRRMPRYQWFLAAALLLLTMEPLIARRRRAAAQITRVWQQEAA